MATREVTACGRKSVRRVGVEGQGPTIAGPLDATLEPRSRVGEPAVHGLQAAGAVLARALVGPNVPRPIVVAVGQDGDHLGGGQLVTARPRLVAARRLQAIEDRGAVLVLRS